jgi:hypothetical protein
MLEYSKNINLLPSKKAGYYQFYDSTHPLAYSNGCVYYHRHVASLKLGRWITTEEHVHHIDGNPLNNDPANLEVLTPSEHHKLHKGSVEALEDTCSICGKTYVTTRVHQKYCSYACADLGQVKNRSITKEALESLMPYSSWRSLGIKFGYSDSGIKKRAIALGCNMSLAKNTRTRVQ